MAETPTPPPAEAPHAPHAPKSPSVMPAELRRRRVARGTRIAVVVVAVLLAVGAGAHDRRPDGERAQVLEANVSRSGRRSTSRRRSPRTSDGEPDAVRCPARCRASSRRRWRRARRATSSAGPRTSAATSKKGELLAEIESPEIDQQLSQAVAARQQTAASLALARSTVDALGGAAQEGRRLAAGARREAQRRRPRPSPTSPPPTPTCSVCASCRASRASTAPFDGVITRRNVDVGDLIDSGGKHALRPHADGPAARLRQRAAVVCAAGASPARRSIVTQSELRGRDLRRRGRAHGRLDRRRRRGRCRSRSRCATRTARCCPAPTSTSSCRSPAARRSSCRPTCCCFAARARASPSSMRQSRPPEGR